MSRSSVTAVLGAAGQLGRDLCSRLAGPVVPLTRRQADLTDPTSLRRVLTEHHPGVVINCAAYNLVDQAEDEPETSFAVNAFAVRRLAEICRDLDARLVHFSTDYVFGLDDLRRSAYRESDLPGPVSVYGVSKLAGEYFVGGLCPRHLVIRTCGLYGRWGSGGKGTNFVETMLRLAAQGRAIKVVNDQVLAPSYTVDVAEAATRLIADGHSGVHHVTNGGACSWYEFARSIFDLANVRADLSPTTSVAYGSRARRPSYSVLISEHTGVQPLRPWQEALAAYLRERPAATQDLTSQPSS